MPSRSHEPQRRPRFGQRPPAASERFQLSRRKPHYDASKHVPNPSGVGFFQTVEIQNVVGHVRTNRRHLLLAEDVARSQLDESTATR